MDGDAARDQKVASAKKTLKKFKKKKAASSVDSTSITRKDSSDSVALTSDRRNSVASDSGSVRTDGTGQETIAVAEEDNISATNINPDVIENQASQDYSDYVPQSSSATSQSLVEGLQPIFQPHGQQSQPNLLSKQIDLTIAESILPSADNSVEEPYTYESLSSLCNKQKQDIGLQRQAIAMLVDEKNALTSELEKYSAMADRFKSSEELLEEGQLLVDALRRKNAELEEKILNKEERFKEADEQKEKILESLQLQNTRVEQLEKDSKQLISQLNTKDSIIEQLTQEKANARSVSDEVEALQKTLQDKENRCEALEIELSNLRHKLTNTEQQLSENIEKLSEAERVSYEAQTNIESMTKEIQQLTNERNELTQEIEKLSSSLKIKEAEVLALSEQVSSNSSVIEKLNLERDDLSKELQNVQSENSKLTKRIKDLTKKIEGLTSDNRDSIAQLNELREKFVEISNDKLRLAEEVDKEKSRATRLEQELLNKLQEVKIDAEEEKKITPAAKTTNGTTTREFDYEENKSTSKLNSSQEELKQLLFKERQKNLNLELQLKRILEVSSPLASSNLNLSPPNSASRRYSFSQFSGDFEIGKCSGCIGEVIIV